MRRRLASKYDHLDDIIMRKYKTMPRKELAEELNINFHSLISRYRILSGYYDKYFENRKQKTNITKINTDISIPKVSLDY